MLINRNCSGSISGGFPASAAGLTWRRWIGAGYALLQADAADLFDLLVTWQKRARMRRQLAAMDTRMLRDIGLTHGDRDCEAAKPFWRT
jgi:uncharacterized protein YjiS (DUF1127 family)